MPRKRRKLGPIEIDNARYSRYTEHALQQESKLTPYQLIALERSRLARERDAADKAKRAAEKP
jgi:hypothetical protein